jgi:hypothetical protein
MADIAKAIAVQADMSKSVRPLYQSEFIARALRTASAAVISR